MFIKTNDRLVNIKNISNVNIINSRRRIVLNTNYSIEINTLKDPTVTKVIADYVYWDAPTDEAHQANIRTLTSNQFFERNFFSSHPDDTSWVNILEISSVKFLAHKLRVIYNLCHPFSFSTSDGSNRVTSDFVYTDCKSREEYDNYVEYASHCIERWTGAVT